MLFIASLATTLGAVYLYEKCEKTCAEAAIACVGVTLIGLVLTLVVAPWQIQMLLVIALASIHAANAGLSD